MKKTVKSLLALALALCLLLGCVAAIAEEPTVTVDTTDTEHATVTVDVGEVGDEGLTISGNQGIEVNGKYLPFDKDGVLYEGAEEYEGEKIGEQLNDAGVTHTDSLTVNADSVSGQLNVYRTTDVPMDEPGDFDINALDEVNVNVYGDVTTKVVGVDDEAYATGVRVDNTAYDEPMMEMVVPVNIQTGDITASATATGTDEDGEEAYAGALGVYVNEMYGTTNIEVNGDISADATSSAAGIQGLVGGHFDMWADSELWADYPEKETEQNGNLNITVNGDVTAEGGKYGSGLIVTAATMGYHDDDYNHYLYEQGGTAHLTINGSVTAKGEETTGISVTTANNADTIVTVTGDVTAEGDKGVGLTLWQNPKNASTDILVGGTLSGGDVAIAAENIRGYLMQDGTLDIDAQFDPLSANIYAWKIEENANGEIARVYDTINEEDKDHHWVTTTPVNKEATAKMEAAINYIVKVADGFKSSVTAKGTGTYTADGTTYDLAHQDEKVTVSYKINEAEEGFDGFYYDGDAKTEAKTDEWGKNDDGSFWVKMLRGGGMLLGLKTHKHEKATREENKVAATCTKEGSYDLVTYCSVCNKVLSTEKKTVAALGHTSGAAVKEKEVAPTCTKAGSYDEVVYCTVCKAEVSRTTKTVAALGHTPAATVKENQKAAKPGVKGTYDEVVYCSVCGEELSREHKETPALAVADVEPAVKTELVYEAVEALNGVKVADHPEAAEALAAVGEALDGENVTVTIPGAEKLMDVEEMKTFNKLPVKDRLLVVLSALGFANDTLGDATADMSDDAKALSETVAERMENLPEAEKQALLKAIGEAFPKGTVTVDGKACESFSIDLVIEKSGNKRYERYTFYDDEGTWKLFGIEQGEYKEVEA